jgi:radical SAM superfamily enzyme YgiQ (UPF0313 family)
MKIKLILAPDFLPRTKFSLPPMGIATLTSVLRKNNYYVGQDDLDIKTRELNLSIFNNYDLIQEYLVKNKNDKNLFELFEKILSKTNYKNFDIIGISCVEPSHLLPGLCIAKLIKQKTNSKILFGGRVGVNSELLKYDFIDYVLNGDSSESILKFVKYLDKKENIQEVPGLSYRKNNSIKTNQVFIPDINKVPEPDFEGFPLEYYSYNVFDTVDPYYETYNKKFPINSKEKILVLPYLLNKGCPFNCSFCAVSASKNRNVFFKNPEKIKKELKYLKNKFKTKYFFFMDSTLNSDYKWLSEVCDEIKGLDILWSDSATPSLFQKGMLKKMRKSGCVRITWGVESLSAKILKKMRKAFNSQTAIETLKTASKAGIWNYTNWIAGFPHESQEELNETLNKIKLNKNYIDDYTVTGFIFQASDMQNHPEKYGIEPIYKENYIESAKHRMITSSFNEINGLTWNEKQKQIENFRKKMVKTFEKSVPNVLPMHTVFYLYDKFKDKDEIKRWVDNLFIK